MKYSLPALKKPKTGKGMEASVPEVPDEYDRKIRIPVNDELLKGLPVGTSATITLVGEICEAEAKGQHQGASIRLKVTSVETDDNNEFTDLLDADE